MKMNRKIMPLFLLLGAMAYGCEMISQEDDLLLDKEENILINEKEGLSNLRLNIEQEVAQGVPQYFLSQLVPFEEKEVNTYTVEFRGRTLNKNDQGNVISTTFKYRVSGNGATPQLDSFFLETPNCAVSVLSFSPAKAAKAENGGIKWNSSVSKDGFENYSITYSGEVSLGLINATVTRGSNIGTEKLIGPCAGVSTISGSIFIDANNNRIKDFNESGLAGIPIELIDNISGAMFISRPTIVTGAFSIMVINGDYSIRVLPGIVNQNYRPTTDILKNIGVVDGVSSNNNFGYFRDAAKMKRELEDGSIRGNTQPLDYWVAQLNQKSTGAVKYNIDYSPQQIATFLNTIENLFLPEPFFFGDNKIENAKNILNLKRNQETEINLFLQQLLTAELNIVSGRGVFKPGTIELDTQFNDALLLHNEAVACNENPNCNIDANPNGRMLSTPMSITAFTRSLEEDFGVLSAFNGTGGIRPN